MYDMLGFFTSIIKEYILPNPFEYITDNTLIAILLFSIISTIIEKIAFSMCGIYYKRGSNKILGRIGNVFCYVINIIVLSCLCKLIKNFVLVIIIYTLLIVLTFRVLYKLKNGIRRNII